MELLETQDPEKRRLIETSERHRRELEKEVSDITQKTEQVLTNALVIGGALTISYLIVSQFFGGKTKKKKKGRKAASFVDDASASDDQPSAAATPSLLAEIGTKVVNQATLILIDIAREKLMEYLQKNRKKDGAS